ncbi:LCP family protein [Puerhibacterium sp. TATVAM-FAB25]|uniref:LCP family protein n=1 Tax=Puerhibacterium sp. TATVAM-FAB25 TaxID=3093699 RepID=UPI00397A2AD3
MSRAAVPQHASSLKAHRALRLVGLVLTGLVAFAGTGAVAAYVNLQSQIDVSDVESLLGEVEGARPTPAAADPDDPFAGRALDILVMGTDFRGGEGNAAIGGAGDEFHSDTTLIVHISGDRSRIEVVSIPRDSLVDIPACPRPGGGTSDPRSDTMFNRAFTIGGGDDKDVTGAAACTILTVQELTGLSITDHVVVEMSGVVGVVDAVGGVTMCLPEPVEESERYGDLALPAGEQRLDGDTAIQFLRVRHGTGMGLEQGSDLRRIERQQAFVSAMVREILSKNLITDSPQLYRVVQAVLQSISTDPDLASPRALAGLAWSVRDIDPSRVVFTAVPVTDAPSNPNRVVWTDEADAIWERLRADEPPPGLPDPAPTATPSGDPSTPSDGATEPDGPAGGSPSPTGAASPDAGEGSGGDADGGDAEPSPTPSVLPGVCA